MRGGPGRAVDSHRRAATGACQAVLPSTTDKRSILAQVCAYSRDALRHAMCRSPAAVGTCSATAPATALQAAHPRPPASPPGMSRSWGSSNVTSTCSPCTATSGSGMLPRGRRYKQQGGWGGEEAVTGHVGGYRLRVQGIQQAAGPLRPAVLRACPVCSKLLPEHAGACWLAPAPRAAHCCRALPLGSAASMRCSCSSSRRHRSVTASRMADGSALPPAACRTGCDW